MLGYVMFGSGIGVPNSGLATVGCIISPMLQLNLMFIMGFAQKAQGIYLNFANLGLDVFPELSLSKILLIACGMALFYAVVILYLWPYKIETDPENPLHWYYPVTPSFWCGKKQTDDE